jgi:hypothetical protein
MQIPFQLELFDELGVAVVTRVTTDRHDRSREQFLNSLVLSKQHERRNRRKEFIRTADREDQILLQKIRRLVKIDRRTDILECTGEGPKQSVVEIVRLRGEKRNVLVSERTDLIEPHRQLLARDFPLLRTEAHVESALARAIRFSP